MVVYTVRNVNKNSCLTGNQDKMLVNNFKHKYHL